MSGRKDLGMNFSVFSDLKIVPLSICWLGPAAVVQPVNDWLELEGVAPVAHGFGVAAMLVLRKLKLKACGCGGARVLTGCGLRITGAVVGKISAAVIGWQELETEVPVVRCPGVAAIAAGVLTGCGFRRTRVVELETAVPAIFWLGVSAIAAGVLTGCGFWRTGAIVAGVLTGCGFRGPVENNANV